jgi:Tir chaperone family protein CesT
MANWDALRGYIHSNYKVASDKGSVLVLEFDLGGGRSQRVIVGRSGEVGGEEWAEVRTTVAQESQISHRDLLLRNGSMVVGGLALDDGMVIFRHSFALSNLDANEFEVPLQTAAIFGDKLEQELTGQDTF